MVMRIVHVQIILITTVLFIGCAQYETAIEKLEWLEPDTFTCDVVQVKSGDTFLCRFPDLEIDTVRLAGIAIPGSYEDKAKQFSKSVLSRGTLVNIEPDKEVKDTESGIPAYVWVPGGKMLNILLIEKGYARALPDEVSERYEAVFIKIEDQNKGDEIEVIEEVETEKKPWVK